MMQFYLRHLSNERAWANVDGLWQATDDIYADIMDDEAKWHTFHLLPGFRCDGGSVPKMFQWFVPSWSTENPVINIAYALHDASYASECLSREHADDLLRGLLRDAGLNRLRASTVCYAVNKFASKHYGKANDNFGCAPFVKYVKW